MEGTTKEEVYVALAAARTRFSTLDVMYLLPTGIDHDLLSSYSEFLKQEVGLPYFGSYAFQEHSCPHHATFAEIGLALGKEETLKHLLFGLSEGSTGAVLPSSLSIESRVDEPPRETIQGRLFGECCLKRYALLTSLLEIYTIAYPFHFQLHRQSHQMVRYEGVDPLQVGSQAVVLAHSADKFYRAYWRQRDKNFPLRSEGKVIAINGNDVLVQFPASDNYYWNSNERKFWKKAEPWHAPVFKRRLQPDVGHFILQDLTDVTYSEKFDITLSGDQRVLARLQESLSPLKGQDHHGSLRLFILPDKSSPPGLGDPLRPLLEQAFRGSSEEQKRTMLTSLAELVMDLCHEDPALLTSVERKLLEQGPP